jgi:hypothetical protein
VPVSLLVQLDELESDAIGGCLLDEAKRSVPKPRGFFKLALKKARFGQPDVVQGRAAQMPRSAGMDGVRDAPGGFAGEAFISMGQLEQSPA